MENYYIISENSHFDFFLSSFTSIFNFASDFISFIKFQIMKKVVLILFVFATSTLSTLARRSIIRPTRNKFHDWKSRKNTCGFKCDAKCY